MRSVFWPIRKVTYAIEQPLGTQPLALMHPNASFLQLPNKHPTQTCQSTEAKSSPKKAPPSILPRRFPRVRTVRSHQLTMVATISILLYYIRAPRRASFCSCSTTAHTSIDSPLAFETFLSRQSPPSGPQFFSKLLCTPSHPPADVAYIALSPHCSHCPLTSPRFGNRSNKTDSLEPTV